MNKTDLIEHMAAQAGINKAEAERALDAFTDAVQTTLVKRSTVTLVGFGTFKTSERAARKGRNPQTGQEIDIAAATMPKFTAGKALKDAVNGRK